jgi:hypothetical protein
METTRPTHVHVASHFFNDSRDFINRFEICWSSESPAFYAIKSTRMKLFIDLRMAMESSLKAIVTFFNHSNIAGEILVKKIESYRHNIEKLVMNTSQFIPIELQEEVTTLCNSLNNLPVGLRYKLDAMDFHRYKEELYYKTIGCDHWMEKTAETIKKLNIFIGSRLSNESRIWGSSELMQEILEPVYRKY